MARILMLSGGWVGFCMICVQGIFFLATLWGLGICYYYYADQLRALRELQGDKQAVRSSSSNQLNNLLDEYDIQLLKNPKGPSISALVAKHVGDERGLKIPKDVKCSRWQIAISRPAFIRFAAGSLIGLGLLGTFIGFNLSLAGVSTSLQTMQSTYSQSEPGTDIAGESIPGESLVSDVITEIGRPLHGMNTAFATSVAGLLFTIIISGVQARWWNYTACRQAFSYELYSFLNTDYLERTGQNDEAKVPAYLKGLQMAAEKIAHSMAEHVDSGFIRVSSQLFEITGGLNITLDRMTSLLDRFSKSAQGLQDVADSFQDYVRNTNASLSQLESMLGAAQYESKVLTSQMAELLNPMSRFAESVEKSVLATLELQSVVEDTGQEILGILTSSVSDFRRVSAATEQTLVKFTNVTSQLPNTVMESSGKAINQALMPIIESLVKEIEEAQEVIAESWLALTKFEDSMDSMASSTALRLSQQIGEALESALAAIRDRQELSNVEIIESAEILYGRTAGAISEEVAKLSGSVSQLLSTNRKLTKEIKKIFMIDELSALTKNEGGGNTEHVNNPRGIDGEGRDLHG